MLQAEKEAQGKILVVRLSGVIDETCILEQVVGTPPDELHFYLRGILRLNSFGVKQWVRYFLSLQQRGTTVKVFEASPAIVSQMSLIVNFIPGASLESLCAPYLCPSCKSQFVAVLKTEDARRMLRKMPEQKCPKCGMGAFFDDIETEYFSFLIRQG